MTIAVQYFEQLMKEQQLEALKLQKRVEKYLNEYRFPDDGLDFWHIEEKPVFVEIPKEKPNPSKGKPLSSLLGKPVYAISQTDISEFSKCMIPFQVLPTGEVLVLEKSLKEFEEFVIRKYSDNSIYTDALPIIEQICAISNTINISFEHNSAQQMLKAYKEGKEILENLEK